MTDQLTPTPEQDAIRALFSTGESLAIEAGAGTGKTATLKMLAEDAPEKRIQYVAFNKAIVDESKAKMPRNVRCNTAHSLAFQAVGKNYQGRIRSSARMKPTDLATALGIERSMRVKKFDGTPKTIGRGFLAGLAMKSIEKFCQSADPEPTRRHVPYVEGLDAPDGDRRSHRPINDAIAREIEPALRRAWADLSRVDGSLPFSHGVYLKLYQLSNPRIDVDVILFDEAQDANPVMAAIVAAQTHAQIVYVGDSQQEIYGFTGAVNALGSIHADRRAFLSQSFRFGPAIAAKANRVLAMIPGAELRLTGFDPIASRVEPLDRPNVVLTRTNAEAVRTMLSALADGLTVALVGGTREIIAFCEAAAKLQAGEWTPHPELTCFDSWAEVQTYVEQDELGGDLRLLVSLIDEFGVDRILDGLRRQVDEDDADLVVSTAHKSKGREWKAVRLAPDFTIQRDGERRLREGASELRLLYVAVTRARLLLDVTAIAVLSEEDGSRDEVPADEPATPETAGEQPVAAAPAPVFRADVDLEPALARFCAGTSYGDRLSIWLALGGEVGTFQRLAESA